MDGVRAFDLLKRISYERMGGTENEMKAINTLKCDIEELGLKANVLGFPIDEAKIQVAKFEVIEPYYKSYEVSGVRMSGETREKGLEAKFSYIEDALPANLYQTKGKIALINNRFNVEAYKRMVDEGVIGFISTSGSLYDDIDNTDLETRLLRPRFYQYGKIPGVTMRIKDAYDLLSSNPKKVKLTLLQKEEGAISHSLVCEIKGTKKPEEVVCFMAHIDSVENSSGAYDNGTGAVTIMELLRFYNQNKPARTIRFMWFGSEEMGLLGSKAYVNEHPEELKNVVLAINCDMTGVPLGKDIACVTGEDKLVSYIDYLGHELGYPIKSYQGVYSSDSTPFADKGIPAVSFARISSVGGTEIHSRKDVISFITPEVIEKTLEFMKEFSYHMINSVIFPVEKKIPENMKEELDKYLGRKDPILVKEEEPLLSKKDEVEKEEQEKKEAYDQLLLPATSFLMGKNVISGSKLQSEFYLSYQRATTILNQLVQLGIIKQGEDGPEFACDYEKAEAIINSIEDK